MIALVMGGDDTATVGAFREECPRGVVVRADAPLEQAVAKLRSAGVSRVLAGTPGAAYFAHECVDATGLEGHALPLDRTNLAVADPTLPTGLFAPCASMADVEEVRAKIGPSVLLRPSRIGDADTTFVCSTAGDTREALARLLSAQAPFVAVGVGVGRRISVDVVRARGMHVVAGVYEHRVDVRGGQQFLRHRLSMALDETAAVVACAYARACLDRLGVHDGATCVEIELSSKGPALIDVLPAPFVPAIPADAAFAAFGHSHQHLFMEAILRPQEFERRTARPLCPGKTTLAIAPLWNWKGSDAGGFAGLRLLRRLTGFHGLTPISSHRGSDGPVAIASFVHPDRVSVENSLTILHEYEDSHGFFAQHDELIGFAAAAS
jgi:hypothetical protein